MKTRILTAILCAIIAISAQTALAEESKPDPMRIFMEDLCNEEAVRVMALEMAEFMAIVSYDESIASTGVSIEEFIDEVVSQMDQAMQEQKIEFTYCKIDETSKVDCAEAAKLIEALDGFKYEKILDALNYLEVDECAAVLFTVQEKKDEMKTQSIAIAGNKDDFWRLITVTDVPPAPEE